MSIKRRVTFLAKAEYFTGSGVKGFLQRSFFSGAGQVPIDRTSASAAEDAIQTGLRILNAGKILGIYPEGTRSPDGRLFRGKIGVARMALQTGVPVVPVAMCYSHNEAAVREEDHAGEGPLRGAAGLLPLRGPGR